MCDVAHVTVTRGEPFSRLLPVSALDLRSGCVALEVQNIIAGVRSQAIA